MSRLIALLVALGLVAVACDGDGATTVADVEAVFTHCDQPNAYYDPQNLRITMCYEFFYFFEEMLDLPDLSDEDFYAAVIGTGAFFFLHELGHALVHVLDLPITGREEDAVDQLATLELLDGVWGDSPEVVSRVVDDRQELEDALTRFRGFVPFPIDEITARKQVRLRVRAALGSRNLLLLIPTTVHTNWAESQRFFLSEPGIIEQE